MGTTNKLRNHEANTTKKQASKQATKKQTTKKQTTKKQATEKQMTKKQTTKKQTSKKQTTKKQASPETNESNEKERIFYKNEAKSPRRNEILTEKRIDENDFTNKIHRRIPNPLRPKL